MAGADLAGLALYRTWNLLQLEDHPGPSWGVSPVSWVRIDQTYCCRLNTLWELAVVVVVS
jgi:hypothetical protein